MDKGYRLTGAFLPSVHLDFGQGKVFSNKIAESFQEFDFEGKEYMYASNDDGDTYTITDIKCPRSAMGIDAATSNNVKVDISDVAICDRLGIIITHGDNVVIERDDIQYPSPLFYEGETVDNMVYPSSIVYRPALVCMPQYAPISHDGVIINEGVKPLCDGERFTIIVKANKTINNNLARWIDGDSNGWVKDDSFRRSGVLVVADQRRFIQSSYRLTDDEVVYAPEGNTEPSNCLFVVGGKYCDAIFLSTGSILKIRANVNNGDVLFYVENSSVFKELDSVVSVYHRQYFDGVGISKLGNDYGSPIELVYASKILSDIQTQGNRGRLFMSFMLSDLDKEHWEDGLVVDELKYDYSINP